MGTIEVYDRPGKWYQHFKDLNDGYVKADHKGHFIVGSGNHLRTMTKMNIQNENPTVKLVKPVTQAIEIAKSEQERARDSPKKKKKTYERPKNYLKDWRKTKY